MGSMLKLVQTSDRQQFFIGNQINDIPLARYDIQLLPYYIFPLRKNMIIIPVSSYAIDIINAHKATAYHRHTRSDKERI